MYLTRIWTNFLSTISFIDNFAWVGFIFSCGSGYHQIDAVSFIGPPQWSFWGHCIYPWILLTVAWVERQSFVWNAASMLSWLYVISLLFVCLSPPPPPPSSMTSVDQLSLVSTCSSLSSQGSTRSQIPGSRLSIGRPSSAAGSDASARRVAMAAGKRKSLVEPSAPSKIAAAGNDRSPFAHYDPQWSWHHYIMIYQTHYSCILMMRSENEDLESSSVLDISMQFQWPSFVAMTLVSFPD